jgi:hypothetical protein
MRCKMLLAAVSSCLFSEQFERPDLSNYDNGPLDLPSQDWRGHYSDRERIRNSGLWNENHVDEVCNAAFLDTL